MKLEYDSGDEKLDDEVSVKDHELEDGCESESEKTEVICQGSTVAEQVEEDAPAVEKETADHLDIAREEKLGKSLEKNSDESDDASEVKIDDMEVERKEEGNEDGLEETNETDEIEEKTEEQSAKEKGMVVYRKQGVCLFFAHFRMWRFLVFIESLGIEPVNVFVYMVCVCVRVLALGVYQPKFCLYICG